MLEDISGILDVSACNQAGFSDPTQLRGRALNPSYVDSISTSTVRVYKVPTDAPEADGTISWDSTTMVLVELAVGDVRGIGYTYADPATAKVVQHLLKTIVESADPF
ncbi:MAG TPA: hypothetical protein VE195_10465, partial [Acidobacteriaceae bacterium]|nr:hypothetical protein [Acidobacteriaceae bacterium]